MVTITSNTVDSKSISYQEMERDWELLHDLLGGTARMRRRGSKWLPKEPKESDESYSCRLNRSFLFEGLGLALKEICTKPFERPVVVQQGEADVDPRLLAIEADVDETGLSLNQFAKEAFRAGWTYGFTHVLIDFPTASPGATRADELSSGARPVFVHVKPPQLLGFRTERIGGVEVLSSIRIYEEAVVPEGEYAERRVERIRVYTRDTWELWEARGPSTDDVVLDEGLDVNPGPAQNRQISAVSGDFEKIEEGNHPFGQVPLVTFYVEEQHSFMAAQPPLEGLAWKNLEHWQSASDQRNILRFARLGVLALFGFSEEEVEESIAWGANKVLRTDRSPQEADAKTVSHDTAPIEAGRQDGVDLKHEMEVMGGEPLIERSRETTATGENREQRRKESRVQSSARELEKMLLKCYEFAARWLRIELPEDFSVDVFTDFGVQDRDMKEVEVLLKLNELGRLPDEELLIELQRRGFFVDGFSVEDVLEKIAIAGPDPELTPSGIDPATGEPIAASGPPGEEEQDEA